MLHAHVLPVALPFLLIRRYVILESRSHQMGYASEIGILLKIVFGFVEEPVRHPEILRG